MPTFLHLYFRAKARKNLALFGWFQANTRLKFHHHPTPGGQKAPITHNFTPPPNTNTNINT
jgi:hypothetical protein